MLENDFHSSASQISSVTRPSRKEMDSITEIPHIGEISLTSDATADLMAKDSKLFDVVTDTCTKYPMARKMRHDGLCGWRAIAYGYFELLLFTGVLDNLYQEHSRLISYMCFIMNYIPTLDKDTITSVSTQVTHLFSKLAEWMSLGNSLTLLEMYFNNADEYNAVHILNYFRLVAAAYIRAFPEWFRTKVGVISIEIYSEFVLDKRTQLGIAGVRAIAGSIYHPVGFGLNALKFGSLKKGHVNPDPPLAQYSCASDEGSLSLTLIHKFEHYDIMYAPKDGAQTQISLPRVTGASYYCPRNDCPFDVEYSHIKSLNNAEIESALPKENSIADTTDVKVQALECSLYDINDSFDCDEDVSTLPIPVIHPSVEILDPPSRERSISLTVVEPQPKGSLPSAKRSKMNYSNANSIVRQPAMSSVGRQKSKGGRKGGNGHMPHKKIQPSLRWANCRKLSAHFNNPNFEPSILEPSESKKLYADAERKLRERPLAPKPQQDPSTCFNHPEFHPSLADGKRLFDELTEKREAALRVYEMNQRKRKRVHFA